MKVNVNDSPDAWRTIVYLNGIKVDYCIEADDEAGYVLVAKHDGRRIIADEHGDPVIERVEGVVRIEPHEAQS